MAATYSICVNDHTLAASKLHLVLWNGSESGKTIKLVCAEAYVRNTATVTGISVCWELIRIDSYTGGNAITPDKHDPSDSAPPGQMAFVALPTTATEISGALAGGNTLTEEGANMQPHLPFYENNGDTIRKQIKVPEGQGILLKQGPFGTIGKVGFIITFTLE